MIPEERFPQEIHSGFYFNKLKKILILKNARSAFLYFKNYRINLINNENEPIGVNFFLDQLQSAKLSDEKKNYQVLHLYYEFGDIFLGNNIDENTPLAINIEYCDYSWVNPRKKKLRRTDVEIDSKVSPTKYKIAYDFIQENLRKGNCYQVNFTNQFVWKLGKNFSPFRAIHNFYCNKNLSAYAHHTFLPKKKELVLSNSPECLFQVHQKKQEYVVHSMPIKGTVHGEDFSKAKLLLQSDKDQSELYMISDLIRNDLAKIDKPRAEVLLKKKLLKVPGLFHLYSRISCKVQAKTSLYEIFKALFPGGSITGAPKVRVSRIIKKVEDVPRGHYCGSTYLDFKGLKTASINIRTSVFSQLYRRLSIGAGGGITLKSTNDGEFYEMTHKVESLYNVLHLHNINISKFD